MKLKSSCFVLLAVLLLSIPAPVFAQDAIYELRFEGRWVEPAPLPDNAHFTRLIGATHNAAGTLFTVGQQASQGIEGVAETGATGNLILEINASIATGDVDTEILGTDGFISPEEVNTFSFAANASHSRFSILTMIAPSPDWFVGVSDLDLLDANGNWRDEIVLDLVSYDAGTEDGVGFSLNNSATTPQLNIANLDSAEPNGSLFGVGSLARLTLTLTQPAPILGDVNCDGLVDFSDINPFIAVLISGVYQAKADVDQNEVVDFSDIPPFIAILISQ